VDDRDLAFWARFDECYREISSAAYLVLRLRSHGESWQFHVYADGGTEIGSHAFRLPDQSP
jgi:hypothetical protein